MGPLSGSMQLRGRPYNRGVTPGPFLWRKKLIRLVLSDLDATLLDTPRSGLTGRAAAAIRAVMAHGAVFGPCTGRSPAHLPGLFGPGTGDL